MSRHALNVETYTTATGHPRLLERPLGTACHVVTNGEKPTMPEKLPTVDITLDHSGFKDLANFPLVQDVVVHRTKYPPDLINGIKPHGHKITSFHYRRVVQMTSATFSHCATSVSFEKMLVSNC